MERHQDSVLRQVEEQGIDYIRLWFSDVVGRLKSIVISPHDLDKAFDEGIGIDGSAIEGLTRSYESDMLLRPDPSTFRVMGAPRGGEAGVMICDVFTPDSEPAASDPRRVLRDALARASAKGLEFFTHPEVEFYLFERAYEQGVGLTPVDQGGYFDYVQRVDGSRFRRDAMRELERMNIHVEYSHHEGGPGQNEIDLRYADALTTADNLLTLRAVVKGIALSEGKFASFMPKPMIEHPGNGMHTHLSLFQNGTNIFHEPGAEYGLSRTARHFIAGLLVHAREYSILTNQFVNSYKRLWGEQEAPSYIVWGHNNRSALVRVPFHKPTKGTSSRVEFRGLDSAANPYLAFAALLAAGLKGIEEEYPLPEGAEDTVWELTERERKAMGIEPLPSDLLRAIESFETSELMADVLGEQVFEYILRDKRREWEGYRRQVTDSELRTTFDI